LPPLEDDAAAPAVVDIRHLSASDLLVLQLPVVGSRHRFPQDAQDRRRELRLDGLQRCLAGLFNTHFCVDPPVGSAARSTATSCHFRLLARGPRVGDRREHRVVSRYWRTAT